MRVIRVGLTGPRRLPVYPGELERLLARRPQGIFINPFERGEIGPDLFRHACLVGLEGLVKNRERAYRGGTCPHWIKVKNPKHPSIQRVKDAFSW